MEKPTLWSEGEGRRMDAEITEVASIDSRGSRVGMYSKIYCPVLENYFHYRNSSKVLDKVAGENLFSTLPIFLEFNDRTLQAFFWYLHT